MSQRTSGILNVDGNSSVIPASKRPDGTLRKERKVREGFVPLEDIGKYKNPILKAHLNRFPEGQPIGGAVIVKHPLDDRRKKKVETKPVCKTPEKSSETPKEDVQEISEEEKLRKRKRALEKKLKQIAELKEKQNICPEQKEKVSREDEVKNELADLCKLLEAL